MVKPHTSKSRKRTQKKYGNRCFLKPKQLKYPICNKFTGKIECKGLNAANFYLNMNIARSKKTKKIKSYLKIQKKVKKLKKKHC